MARTLTLGSSLWDFDNIVEARSSYVRKEVADQVSELVNMIASMVNAAQLVAFEFLTSAKQRNVKVVLADGQASKRMKSALDSATRPFLGELRQRDLTASVSFSLDYYGYLDNYRWLSLAVVIKSSRDPEMSENLCPYFSGMWSVARLNGRVPDEVYKPWLYPTNVTGDQLIRSLKKLQALRHFAESLFGEFSQEVDKLKKKYEERIRELEMYALSEAAKIPLSDSGRQKDVMSCKSSVVSVYQSGRMVSFLELFPVWNVRLKEPED